jgi:hypothetical protein
MTKTPTDDLIPMSIAEWFAERGYSLAISRSDRLVWTDLLADGRVFWPRYGRGHSAAEAAESARRRHIDEEGGAPRHRDR